MGGFPGRGRLNFARDEMAKLSSTVATHRRPSIVISWTSGLELQIMGGLQVRGQTPSFAGSGEGGCVKCHVCV